MSKQARDGSRQPEREPGNGSRVGPRAEINHSGCRAERREARRNFAAITRQALVDFPQVKLKSRACTRTREPAVGHRWNFEHMHAPFNHANCAKPRWPDLCQWGPILRFTRLSLPRSRRSVML